ncbi:MAG TPA: hypothetical protein DGG94_09845 [Micromonosporaceae bacterium]|nr:hypothetical protein [Micromonosporaceae bacterium]HCU50086.1 hypothetical protein [Micromonosporaceae bacterium]
MQGDPLPRNILGRSTTVTAHIQPTGHHGRSRTIGIAVAVLAALVLAAPPATAAQAGSPHQAAGSYLLTIATEVGQHSVATLQCKPTGGTHPHKSKACRQLVRADGQMHRIPPTDAVCTREYAPVTVKAEGVWYGTYYEHKETFDNRCLAIVATGGYLFNF